MLRAVVVVGCLLARAVALVCAGPRRIVVTVAAAERYGKTIGSYNAERAEPTPAPAPAVPQTAAEWRRAAAAWTAKALDANTNNPYLKQTAVAVPPPAAPPAGANAEIGDAFGAEALEKAVKWEQRVQFESRSGGNANRQHDVLRAALGEQ
ncbi:hypothetical protein M885DRAFT_504558 [Pelagophyceae sp. CCMP2097]|nr:hypothetical protein M885DRAFT_504558 [Pelagophyceae sp. CCMP2097]